MGAADVPCDPVLPTDRQWIPERFPAETRDNHEATNCSTSTWCDRAAYGGALRNRTRDDVVGACPREMFAASLCREDDCVLQGRSERRERACLFRRRPARSAGSVEPAPHEGNAMALNTTHRTCDWIAARIRGAAPNRDRTVALVIEVALVFAGLPPVPHVICVLAIEALVEVRAHHLAHRRG